MSTFLSVYLIGASVSLLLVRTLSQAQDYNHFTPPLDYNYDFNTNLSYSFYSNTSIEELDKFSERFTDQEEEDDTGGWQERVTITMATRGSSERAMVDVRNATSLPVSPEIRMLVWTLMILISLNLQQLQHTL